jgi:putative ATP-dependent endonuclease of the OLD family
MKIESVRIENLRSFRDAVISLDDYTCLVGPNGGGKSTVLCALNVFFRETDNSSTDVTNLSVEDFHRRDTARPVQITVTFADLSTEAQEDFKDYFRHGKLIVSACATFDPSTNRAEVKQYGLRLGMEALRPFFQAEGDRKPVAALKEIYQKLTEAFPDLPAAGTKDAMIAALRAYEAAHPQLAVPIPSEDQFYGVTRGANRLEKYLQWIYVPAVKDVTTEQTEAKNTALGKLLARTVRLALKFDDAIHELQKKTEKEYAVILQENQDALTDLAKSLGERLATWAHPEASVNLAWQQDSRKSVQIEQPTARTTFGEGGFEGNLARLGHGFQRSYLLALLQVLATARPDKALPRLVLGCEEPELYQHPPQARHLASVLEELSTHEAQVMISSTHDPIFITGKGFEGVRLIRFDPVGKESQSRQLTFEDLAQKLAAVTGDKPTKPSGLAAKLHQALQPSLNELFFSKNLVLVEGLEDLAIITSWMVLTDRWKDFRRKGLHIVPVNGKSYLLQPLAISQELRIPVFTMFDADRGTDPKHEADHKRENTRLLTILGGNAQEPFPTDTIWAPDYVIWSETIGDTIKKEIPPDKLVEFENKANALYGNAGGLQKNSLQIGAKLQLAFEAGIRPPSLEKLCEAILAGAVG